MNALLSLIFVSLCGISHALHLPVVARSPLPRRMMDQKAGVPMHQVHILDQNVENARDVVYATNITIGGKEFPIQLDTGSSDVWVLPPFPIELTNTTDIPANLTFGIGEVTGNIAFADMSFGPYTVPSQAILNATNATDFDAIFSNGIFGIMGLSFDIASTVFVETAEAFGVNNTQGLTFLSRLFLQNSSAPNLFTVLLGRSYDKDGPDDGAFTISEYVDGFEQVADQTKLFRTPAQTVNLTSLPRWSVQMDSMTVNGKQFPFNQSSVPEADPGKQVVVLDTGFTFSQLPPAAVNFIYSSISGATFNQTSGLWNVPCESTTDLSFEFGNKSYPIHPLDISTVTSNGNQTICTNAFQAISLPPGAAAGFDFILGDSFLKNAYVSFDYGDFTPSDPEAGVPFVQMLPTTDLTIAATEFQMVRQAQVQKNDQQLAQPQGQNSSAGSISVDDGLTHFVIPSTSKPKVEKRGRVVIFHGSAHTAQPVPFVHDVADCMNRVNDAFGPVAVALLVGTAVIVVILVIVGVIMSIRMWVGKRRDEGYEPLEIKEDVLFDEQRDSVGYNDYHHDLNVMPSSTYTSN